jgi:hypothetical protein
LAVPPLLSPELVELPELRHPLASRETAPAVATAFVRVIPRMSSLLVADSLRTVPSSGRKGAAYPETRLFDLVGEFPLPVRHRQYPRRNRYKLDLTRYAPVHARPFQ